MSGLCERNLSDDFLSLPWLSVCIHSIKLILNLFQRQTKLQQPFPTSVPDHPQLLGFTPCVGHVARPHDAWQQQAQTKQQYKCGMLKWTPPALLCFQIIRYTAIDNNNTIVFHMILFTLLIIPYFLSLNLYFHHFFSANEFWRNKFLLVSLFSNLCPPFTLLFLIDLLNSVNILIYFHFYL